MRITLPFAYSARGILPGKRNPSEKTFYDNVDVNLREIDPSEFEHALTLVNLERHCTETFYHFDGSFWIEDGRDDPSEIADQHLMLAGHWPAKARPTQNHFATARERNLYRPYTAENAARDNTNLSMEIAALGYLRTKTAKVYNGSVMKGGELTDGFLVGPTGIESIPTSPEHEYRILEHSNIAAKRMAAVEYAQSNVISVSGKLWHRVPAPVVYATDKKVDWCFSESFGTLTSSYNDYDRDRKDTSAHEAYRMPMCGEDILEQAFPSHFENCRVAFTIDFMDDRFFEAVDLRKGVVKNIEEAIKLGYGLAKLPTAQIAKWCELRDLVGNPKVDFLGRPDGFFDEAAAILQDMDSMGMGNFAGAAMWNERDIDMELTLQPPAMKS